MRTIGRGPHCGPRFFFAPKSAENDAIAESAENDAIAESAESAENDAIVESAESAEKRRKAPKAPIYRRNLVYG